MNSRTVRLSDHTLRWVKRLKSIMEYGASSSFTVDETIAMAVASVDYEIAKSMGSTKAKTTVEYIIETQKKLDVQYPEEVLDALARMGR